METREIIIIGSGPAGCTAALYSARAELRPLVIAGFMAGGQSGGQLMTTTDVENFPGFPEGILGPDLMDRLRKQAVRFGAEVIDKDVLRVDFSKRPFQINTDEVEYRAKAVIVSTGANARRFGDEFENRFWNKGISACATCDGALPIFRNRHIVVVGGGDTAMEEATFLTRFASEVTVVHRRNEFRASKIMLDRVRANPKIRLKTPYVVVNTSGDSVLNSVTIKNVETGETEEMSANGLFLAIGHDPNTGILKGQIELEKNGYVKTDGHTRTNIPGVFAAGDCVDYTYRQAVTAAGMGCMAALQAERFLAANP